MLSSIVFISRINSADKEYILETILSEHADVFKGLVTFLGTYHIQIDKTVTPIINPPRNISYTFMSKLKVKLENMV